MANKIWLDEQGRVLVNDDGHPYYTEECCCVPSQAKCWQLYTATCVDNNNNPVYGPGGNANYTEEHWSEPRMVSYRCKTPGSDIVAGKWSSTAPGTAHVWVSRELECSACDAPLPPEQAGYPDFACSCKPVWTNIMTAVLPHYDYAHAMFRYLYYASSGGASVGEAMVAPWEAAPTPPVDGVYTMIETLSARQCHCYIANFVSSGLTGPEPWPYVDDTAWRSSWSSMGRHSYTQYVATSGNSRTVLVDYPADTDVKVPVGMHDMALYMSNNSLMHAYVETNGTDGYRVARERIGGYASTTLVSYVDVMPCDNILGQHMTGAWEPVSFARDQWGGVNISFASSDAADLALWVVREARGAMVSKKDTPTVATRLNADTSQVLEGSPCFLYRAYITTEYPLASINAKWVQYGRYQISSGQRTPNVALKVNAEFCPAYNHIYFTADWFDCDNDPGAMVFPPDGSATRRWTTPPNMCDSMRYASTVMQQGFARPYASMWASLSGVDRSYWMVEADESVDEYGNPSPYPQMRLKQVSDGIGHAYQVIKLGLENYPTWYTGTDAISALNPALYDVPYPVFDDIGYYAYKGCAHPELCWPASNACISAISASSAWQGTWSSVSVISHIAHQAWQLTDQSQYTGVYTSRAVLPGYGEPAQSCVLDVGAWYEGEVGGCPEWRWNAATLRLTQYDDKCLITAFGEAKWMDYPRAPSFAVNTAVWLVPGDFTWEGHVYDPQDCVQTYYPYSTGSRVSPITLQAETAYSSSDDKRVWSWHTTSRAAMIYQYPAAICRNYTSGYVNAPDSPVYISRLMASYALSDYYDPPPANQPERFVLPAGASITYEYDLYVSEAESHEITSCYVHDTGWRLHTYDPITTLHVNNQQRRYHNYHGTATAHVSTVHIVPSTVVFDAAMTQYVFAVTLTETDMHASIYDAFMGSALVSTNGNNYLISSYYNNNMSPWTSEFSSSRTWNITVYRTANPLGSYGWSFSVPESKWWLGHGDGDPNHPGYGAPTSVNHQTLWVTSVGTYNYYYGTSSWNVTTTGTSAYSTGIFDEIVTAFDYKVDLAVELPITSICGVYGDIAEAWFRRGWVPGTYTADDMAMQYMYDNSCSASGSKVSSIPPYPPESPYQISTYWISSRWNDAGTRHLTATVNIIMPEPEEDI